MEEIASLLREFRNKRDWNKFHLPKDLAISVSIEAAELLEIFQWLPADFDLDEKMKKRVGDEVADVVIYCYHLLDVLGLNIEDEVRKKISTNELRFPGQ